MAELHGIERLRWLQEDDPHSARSNGPYAPVNVPRHEIMTTKEVEIEVATALIEELHDALRQFYHGAGLIVHHTESSDVVGAPP